MLYITAVSKNTEHHSLKFDYRRYSAARTSDLVGRQVLLAVVAHVELLLQSGKTEP